MSREDKTASTHGTADVSPASIEAMTRVKNEILARQSMNGDKWTLISPDGRVYIGNPGELLPTLLHEHPLIKGNFPW